MWDAFEFKLQEKWRTYHDYSLKFYEGFAKDTKEKDRKYKMYEKKNILYNDMRCS